MPSRKASRAGARRVVALLSGRVEELTLLRGAWLAGTVLDAGVQACWVPGPQPSPARPLLREIALDSGLEELSQDGFRDLLETGAVGSVMLAPSLWARVAGALWRRLDRAAIYVCRQAALPPASVLCCADSEATAEGLVQRLREGLTEHPTRLTLLRALPPPPPWAPGLLALAGCVLPADDCGATPRLSDDSSIRELVVMAPAARAVAAACSEGHADLLVAGWHRHALPLPERWLHPTAWRLSMSFPGDVLLLPLGA